MQVNQTMKASKIFISNWINVKKHSVSHRVFFILAKQRDERKKVLEKQNEAMKKQRENALADSLEANNKAADKSLNEAYVAYMLSKRNLAQQLKALGISGGGSETVVTDMSNTYANNRFGIEDGRNTANAAARRDYDSGINSDYIDYLSALAKIDSAYNDKIYSIAGDKASTLSTLAKSAQSAASKSTASAPKQTVTGVRIGNDSTVYTSGEQLLQAFKNMGFTKEQAIAYAAAQGIKIEG